MGDKKIRLPNWVEPMANQHAATHVEAILNLNPSNPKYKKAFTKEKQKFLKEFYDESLIPKVSNPAKAEAAYLPFEKTYFDGVGSFIDRKIPDVSAAQKQEIMRQFKSAVMLITNKYVEYELGLRTHRGQFANIADPSQLSDMEFPAGITSKEARLDYMKKIVKNHYKRLLVVASIMSLLEPVFAMPKAQVDDFINNLLDPLELKQINTPEQREAFARDIRTVIKGDLGGIDIIKELKRNYFK
jgi:hypothetical protein